MNLDTTIETYLRGCVGFEVDHKAINTILIDRAVYPGTDVTTLDKRTKELCKADLYMWCSTTPSVIGSVEDAHGEWKHKEGGSEISEYDKRRLRMKAYKIYALYEEDRRVKGICMKSSGMKIWRK